MLTQNSTTVSRNKYQLVKNLNVAYMYNTIANSSAYACRLQLAAGQLLVLTVGRWFQAAAAASQCSFDDCPRIHSLDGLRFSKAIEALDGELVEMEAGAENTLDSLGSEVAGAGGGSEVVYCLMKYIDL